MELSKREKIVLDALIQQFIINATPVSSSVIARTKNLGISPASVRHILADLEQKGYIYQPHTSAGRIPVEQGYRLYVDALMRRVRLSADERKMIADSLETSSNEFENVMREATRILAYLSHQLSVTVSPKIDNGIFQRMELVKLASDRILVVISIKSGLIKTITLEIPSDIPDEDLGFLNSLLNERLSEMRIGDIRKLFAEIVRDIQDQQGGLLEVMVNDVERVFDFAENKELFYMGTRYIGEQPEFSDVQKFTSMVELLEQPNVIIQLLNTEIEENPYIIRIGQEIKEERMRQCSIIAAHYRVGNIAGTIGLIGPMRMNYGKLVSVVEYIANVITNRFYKN